MKYREILKKKNDQYQKIEDLKSQSHFKKTDYNINETIKKEKFKYKFYNALLKKGDK